MSISDEDLAQARNIDVEQVRLLRQSRGTTNETLEALPDAYDTMLSRVFVGGTELSGGQWQRVALARAVFRDAPLVIMD